MELLLSVCVGGILTIISIYYGFHQYDLALRNKVHCIAMETIFKRKDEVFHNIINNLQLSEKLVIWFKNIKISNNKILSTDTLDNRSLTTFFVNFSLITSDYDTILELKSSWDELKRFYNQDQKSLDEFLNISTKIFDYIDTLFDKLNSELDYNTSQITLYTELGEIQSSILGHRNLISDMYYHNCDDTNVISYGSLEDKSLTQFVKIIDLMKQDLLFTIESKTINI